MLCPAHMLGYLLTICLALTGTHLRPSLFRVREMERNERRSATRPKAQRLRNDRSLPKRAQSGWHVCV
jgi:hypothetical protein